MICKYCGILIAPVPFMDGLRFMTDLKYCGFANGLDCEKSPHKLHYPRESNVQTQD